MVELEIFMTNDQIIRELTKCRVMVTNLAKGISQRKEMRASERAMTLSALKQQIEAIELAIGRIRDGATYLNTLQEICAALDTSENGRELVAVAKAAHDAELELARIKSTQPAAGEPDMRADTLCAKGYADPAGLLGHLGHRPCPSYPGCGCFLDRA